MKLINKKIFRKRINKNKSFNSIFKRNSSRVSYKTGSWLDQFHFIPTLNVNDFQKNEFLIPIYQVMDMNGNVLDPKHDPNLDEKTIEKMYKDMVKLDIMDNILYDIQRQGRISFYMTNYGEGASHIGSAAALTNDDVVFGQYREAGVLLWRGFKINEFLNQCYSNKDDYGKGRQMPVHYGKAELNFQTISSPLGTQISQASGSGYAQKLMGKKNCTICYFGDGAASEGDFHAAMNFAATLECPTIFFCRNNGFAISTPVNEQYRGDGIASRGYGYGIDTFRIDGNDIWAVYNTTKLAREISIEKSRPILIEAMSYRIGHHSTSDDSSRYRSTKEVEKVNETNNPLFRLINYMKNRKLWKTEYENFGKEIRKKIISELKIAEVKKKPGIEHMFSDVYDELPNNLKEQQNEMKAHLSKYSQEYKEIFENFEK